MIELDQIQTVAFAGVTLFVGYGIRQVIPGLLSYNIPAAVVGGLLVAGLLTLARAAGATPIVFDTALQTPLMVAFFTSIGFGASLSMLRTGGPAVLVFLMGSTLMAVVQNALGATTAMLLGQHPLVGVLAGSVTLTGGPATGLAFAPEFERAGVPGAATIAVAVAMAGIVAGGIIGGPIGTWLLAWTGRPALLGPRQRQEAAPGEPRLPAPDSRHADGDDPSSSTLLKTVVLILAAMSAGVWVSHTIAGWGVTLPIYIGAMLAAAGLRNFDDVTKSIDIATHQVDELGTAALSIFLVMALMTLKLWDLAGLALPLGALLLVQVGAVALAAAAGVFRLMGRDYEAAVMASGFCGFMLGTTANAMANMTAIVERYGPAPKAFLVVPMVGAFFIDFANALIITLCINVLR